MSTSPPHSPLPPGPPSGAEPSETPDSLPAPPSGTCISCGKPSPDQLSLCPACQQTLKGFTAAAPVGDEPVVIRGRVCLQCGYQLDGLRSDRECPECGTPVARSLQGDLLRYSAPDHLRMLHVGITIAEAAVCMIVPLMLVMGGMEVVAASVSISSAAVSFLGEGLGVVLTTASIVGWWMFSTPDPIQLGRDTAIGARRLLRASLVAELVVSVVQFGVSFLVPIPSIAAGGPGGGGGIIGGGVETLSLGLAVISGAAFLVRFFTSLMYMQTIALRIPNASLYKHAGRFMWLGPVVTVVLCGFGIIFAYISYIVLLESARRLVKHERARAAAMQTIR